MRAVASLFLAAFMSFGSAAATDSPMGQPRRFIIEVTSTLPGQEQVFRAALGHTGRVEFIEATTPFKKELTAGSLTFMFEVVAPEGKPVLAQLHGEIDGTLTLHGSIGGKFGKITDEPWNCATLSFGPF